MGCPTRQELLEALNPAAPGAAVRDHLQVCASCRSVSDGMAAAAEVFSRTPYAAPAGPCLSDSELTAFARRQDLSERVEEHLASCAACRDEAVDLAEALSADAAAAVPEVLRQRVLDLGPAAAPLPRRVPTARTRMTARSRPARRPAPTWVWLAGAAAAFALVVLLFAIAGNRPDSPPGVVKDRPAAPKREVVREPDPPPAPAPREEPPKPPELPKPEEPKPAPGPVRKEEPKPPDRPKPPDPEPPKPKPEPPPPAPKPEAIVRKPEEPKPAKPETVVEAPKVVKYLPVRVAAVNGPVALRGGGKLQKGAELARQDEAFTDHRHLASVGFEGGVVAVCEKSTSFSIEQPEGGETRLALKSGTAFFKVEKRPSPFVVSTPSADALVVGTSFQVEADEKRTVLHVLEGAIRFRNEKGEVVVNAGQRSIARRAEKPSPPVKLDVAAVTAWSRRPDLEGNPRADLWIEHAAGANRKFPGLVVAAPYAQGETSAARVAVPLAEAMDVGLLLGHNHRDREKKVWLNIDRGMEHEVRDDGTRGPAAPSDRAKRITAEYLGHLKAAAGVPENRPAPMVVCLRVHSEQQAGAELEVCEVAWTGWNRRTIEQLKALYAQLLDKHKPGYRMEMRFEGVDDSYEYKGQKRRFMFTESDAEGDGYMAPRHSQNAIAFFFNLSFGRHPEDLDAYVRIFTEMTEFLWQQRRR